MSVESNKILAIHGGPKGEMDENLIVEYEEGPTRIYWVSVYGSAFVKATKGFFTKQGTYQDFCVEVASVVPVYRTRENFRSYINERLNEAAVREPSPGMEGGAVVRDAIFYTLWQYRRSNHTRDNCERFCDYDDEERVKKDVEKGDPAFIETRKDGPGFKEIFVRINALMAFMTFLQAQGNFESKISREEVVTELTKIARRPYSATGVSPRRLRSSYPIPYTLYWEWRVEDTKLGQEEGT